MDAAGTRPSNPVDGYERLTRQGKEAYAHPELYRYLYFGIDAGACAGFAIQVPVRVRTGTHFSSAIQVPVGSRHKLRTSFLSFCEFCRCVCCPCSCFFRTYGVYHMISYCCTNIERLYGIYTDTGSNGRIFSCVCCEHVPLVLCRYVVLNLGQRPGRSTVVEFLLYSSVSCHMAGDLWLFSSQLSGKLYLQQLPLYGHLCLVLICRKGCPRRRQTTGVPVSVPASIVRK